MHHRRYTLSRVKRLFARTGFEIVKATHSGVIVYPAFAAVKMWNRFRPPQVKQREEEVVAGYIQYTASSAGLGGGSAGRSGSDASWSAVGRNRRT